MSAEARLAALRVVRSPRALAAAGAWVLLALVAAFAERARAWPAAGHVLLGAYGAFALPLLAYVVTGATHAGSGASRAARPLVAWGADPVRVAAGALAVAAASSALACGVLGLAVTLVAHGPGDPPALHDALTAAWIGALGGLAYAALFAFGAALFKGGAGRAMLLAVDWIFGAGRGASAILVPRAHVRSLLGGAAPLDASQRASSLWLAALAVAFAALALLLARRARR